MKLLDKDIRQHLYSYIAHKGNNDTIIDELGLTRIVADVAVLNENMFAGYEIKSDGDTLARLPLQATMYSKVFSHSYLVATSKHVDKALELIPDHWGVIQATYDQDSQKVLFTTVRESSASTEVSKAFIARLLWKEELLHALESLKIDKGVRSKNKRIMRQRLNSHVSTQELQNIVCRYMLKRKDWKTFRQFNNP